MIKFRYSSFEKTVTDKDLDIVEGELVSDMVRRVFDEIEFGDHKVEEVFQVSVNGNKIENELWRAVALKETDEVLISPNLKSGEGGQIIKTILIIAVTVVASVLLTPAGGATIGSALLVAGVSIGTTLLLNALIPPPVPDIPQFGDAGTGDLGDSQMYSITSQSNAVKKLGTVPRVYGQHRIYPLVAANPYTELEVDPDTGQLVQYLYAVYDFGLGPLVVDNIKIGDTPIGSFSDFAYRLVDFNKPVVSEGYWDDACGDFLAFYRGDRESDAVAVALNYDQNAGGSLDGYQAERESAPNVDGVSQEITVTFINPTGLYGYSAQGTVGERNITLQIEFAPVGTNDYHGYNDADFVESFTSSGGDEAVYSIPLNFPAPTPYGGGPGEYTLLSNVNSGRRYTSAGQPNPYPNDYYEANFSYRQIGYPVGTTRIVATSPGLSGVAPGLSSFYYKGQFFGTVIQITPSPYPGYSYYDFLKPFQSPIVMSNFEGYFGVYGGPFNNYRLLPDYYFSYDLDLSGRASVNLRSLGKARISKSQTTPGYSSFKFVPKMRGQFKVRVTRISTGGQYTSQVQDNLSWVTITTRFDRAPIQTDLRHTFIELKIRATNQLNGAIQNLSAICTSVLDVYDPDTQTWSKQPTVNPAWVFCDLLTGSVNKRAIDKSRLHMPSILEWRDFCDEVPTPPPSRNYTYGRFQTNFVLDYAATLQTVINQVTSACQASLNLVDGKYGILVDKLRTVPVQIFTPRNSKDFTSQRSYAKHPDSVTIKFIDPSLDWQVSEIVVYDNGFNFDNAIETDELVSFAVTNPEQAWRFGRYMIAQNRLRQETIGLTVDFEHLVCTRGDYVQITQDVMRVGGTPARVKSVIGNRITIDDGIVSVPAITYGYIFRGVDGLISTDTLTIVNATTFDLDGDMPNVGDLIVIGQTSKLVYDCLVKSIAPNDDLSAQLVLVEKADGIYEYESTDLFSDYDPQFSPTTNPETVPPTEVEDLIVSDFGYDCAGAGYAYYIEVDWDAPSGSAYEKFEVFVDYGQGYSEVAETRQSIYKYIVDPLHLGEPHSFKVIAVAANGNKLDLGAVGFVTQTPLAKTASPSDVERLDIDITNEVLQLVWPQIPDCDAREYLIRYSPLLTGTWEASIPLLRVDNRATLAATQARTGTYLIKAIDFNGNESENAAVAITTVPNLFNLNIIETLTDSPDWFGTTDRVEVTGETLLLDTAVVGGVDTLQYYSEGYYYYNSLLDLGEIYTVRLQSLIQAEGYTLGDFMASWVTLDQVAFLSTARYSEWDVETQYRSTETLNVIADWVTLDSVDAMDSGIAENYTEWRKFVMGDATGRVFQFRLKLISNKLSVSPRVFAGNIRADMPDRVESYNNLEADDTVGYILNFMPAFAGPGTKPNIQISIDSAESGDYWAFDYRDLTGFQIKFFNKNDEQVARQFDVAVKGYGRKAAAVI